MDGQFKMYNINDLQPSRSFIMFNKNDLNMCNEDKLDWYEEVKEAIFKRWSCEPPQIPLTQEEYNNIPKNNL